MILLPYKCTSYIRVVHMRSEHETSSECKLTHRNEFRFAVSEHRPKQRVSGIRRHGSHVLYREILTSTGTKSAVSIKRNNTWWVESAFLAMGSHVWSAFLTMHVRRVSSSTQAQQVQRVCLRARQLFPQLLTAPPA